MHLSSQDRMNTKLVLETHQGPKLFIKFREMVIDDSLLEKLYAENF